jgi:hypothetical protein
VSVPGRCHIDGSGRLRGPVSVTYNSPWPTEDGTPGGFGEAWGAVIHTEVGYEHNVIAEFNTPAAKASAFFSISMTGAVHQYGPLGSNWMAWTQVDGNPHYRGVEHEDHGNDANPITDVQLAASAQVFEAMSAFDGWPLEPTDDPSGGRGIIFHVDGGAAWGGHDCPGPVRERQRPALIALAKAIRAGGSPVTGTVTEHITAGNLSLHGLAEQHHCDPSLILRLTAEHSPGSIYPGDVASFINHVFAGTLDPRADMPAGLHLFLPQ